MPDSTGIVKELGGRASAIVIALGMCVCVLIFLGFMLVETKIGALLDRIKVLEIAQEGDNAFHQEGKRYTVRRGEAFEKTFDEHTKLRFHIGGAEEFAVLRADVGAAITELRKHETRIDKLENREK